VPGIKNVAAVAATVNIFLIPISPSQRESPTRILNR
jgi:hypothetical protein